MQLAYPGFYATRVLHVLLNPQMTHQDDFWYSVDNSRGFTFFIIEYSTTTIVFFLTFYLFLLWNFDLKLTSHCTLHYLRSANLSKSFSQFIVSAFIFFQHFFQWILLSGKVWGYPTLLNHDLLTPNHFCPTFPF